CARADIEAATSFDFW
nr:immunoglobulin heavy chain junction region [Macaca mulatta]MOX61485.1 immunoglobulin heavy chain junction region [Macaca mulatta]MOX62936.1 immunoglobulin heavy chain junction region [Macaca mulatta]MOX68533.1 immunoglobulin heavy chain junction region [Macaca mulatta]